MKDKELKVGAGEGNRADEGFLSRWSRRKQEIKSGTLIDEGAVQEEKAVIDVPPLRCDEDMPPLESLTEESDFSGFLSPAVSEELRKLALRKLFHGAGFNTRDGLDDYDEDFTSFVKLGDVMTADLKHRLETEARRQAAGVQDHDDPSTVVLKQEESDASLDVATQEKGEEPMTQSEEDNSAPSVS